MATDIFPAIALTVLYQPIGGLAPDPRNARTHPKRQLQQIEASIRAFGFTNPILVDADGAIIAGHGRLQAEAWGGLDAETRRRLRLRGPVQAEGLELGVGARLRRDWRGKSVEVVVAEDGFLWEGRRFASLSAAATAIAGTRWNGPKFFGLRRPSK